MVVNRDSYQFKRLLNLFNCNADGKWLAENLSYDWIGTVVSKKTAFDMNGISNISPDAVPGVILGYNFNTVGDRSSITLPNGTSISNLYNGSGMLTDMISSYGKVQFGYDTDNRLQGCLRGYREQNSNTDKWKVQTHYAYDSRNIGRLIAITNAGLDNNAVPNITVAPTAAAGTNGSIFDEFVYDDFGRLTSYNAIATSLNNSLKRTISFDYDSRGQLSTENHQKADATYWAKMVYNYDDTTGINLSKIDRQTPTDTAVIPGDQLTINSDNRITNNGYIFKDITGNPTKYNGNNMLYDADDRLIKVLSVSTLWAVLFNDIVKMSDHYVS